VGDFVAAGGAVDAAEGATGGVEARGLGVASGVGEVPVAGDVGDAAPPVVGVTRGDAVAVPEGSGAC
jgi:hypothetical protein